MTARAARVEAVDGGNHGVVAGFGQMRALAAAHRERAEHLREMAGLGPRVAADPELVSSSVLSPRTFVVAQAQVLDATTGLNGLIRRALELETDSWLVEATARAYEASEVLVRDLATRLAAAVGEVTGRSLPAVIVPAVLMHLAVARVAPEQQERAAERLEQLLHEHPRLAQHLVNSGGGLLTALLPGPQGLSAAVLGDDPTGPPTAHGAARFLALVLGNRADVEVTRVDEAALSTTMRRAPADLEGLLAGLAAVNDLDREPGVAGAVQIHTLTLGDERRHVVHIPGTDDTRPLPRAGPIARDMLTNYQLLGGLDSSYSAGVVEAMRDAGLSGERVMLVGHSQGGMVAADIASDPALATEFGIGHVVTAGSPTAQVAELPDGTVALHLENRGDVVPLLDGQDNPAGADRVTVRFDAGDHDLGARRHGTGADHGLDRYVLGASAVDACEHGSVRDLLRRMREAGFLVEGARVEEVLTYSIVRPG